MAGEQDGDERDSREQAGEHDAGLRPRQAAPRERDPDQHRAEAVGERPRSLGRDDPARVRGQRSPTACLHQA
jgi:hypothetical protein